MTTSISPQSLGRRELIDFDIALMEAAFLVGLALKADPRHLDAAAHIPGLKQEYSESVKLTAAWIRSVRKTFGIQDDSQSSPSQVSPGAPGEEQ
jgi:hypothetical protein